MIPNHKLLVVIFKKDVASLSYWLQRILLRIHQYNIRILYKPKPQLLIADWLSRHNHDTNKEEIPDMYITINTNESCTDIPDCMIAEEIRIAILDDEQVDMLSEPILHSYPSTKAELQEELQPY